MRSEFGTITVARSKVSISVEAYQLGAENTKERLRDLVQRTLADFRLTGAIE